MKRGTKRKIKKFVSNNTYALFFIAVFAVLGFMTTGYALLKSTGTLSGLAEIIASGEVSDPDDMSNLCMSDLTFTKNGGWASTFVYDITINNNSSDAYNTWKLKFPKKNGVTVQYGSGTLTEFDDHWLLVSYAYNGNVPSKESVTASVTFNFDSLGVSSEEAQEVANEYLEYIVLSGCGRAETGSEEDMTITNGNASITLGQFEEQIDFVLTRNEGYISPNANEKEYVLSITNNTETEIIGIKGNMWYGANVEFTMIQPGEIKTEEETNVTFQTPSWVTISPGGTRDIYIHLVTEDESFMPDIVLAALMKQ